MRPAGGFTLLELIFVVLLIGIMTSIAIPRISTLGGINLRNGSSQIANYLRAAYEQAVMKHQRVRVRFDFTKRTYWAETYQEPEPEPLLDENTKLEEVYEKFEERNEKPPLTPEEELTLAQERYKKVEGGSLKRGELPSGVKFKGIYTNIVGKTVDSGDLSVEFSPGGFADKTIVYLENDAEAIYSVILPSLGGRSTIERGEVRPDDV